MKTKVPTAVPQSGEQAETVLPLVEKVTAEQVQAADVLAVDEHAGKGGSFIFDPGTGKRTAA